MNDEISIKIRSSKNEWHELKVNKNSLIQCLDKEILSKFLEETELKNQQGYTESIFISYVKN
ncbi:hypothetical protein SJC03_173 [Bacteroides phage SJC03]|nr:hypothetical protein SJC03_173 [Bacteroides phage SJC03]